jgi:uncharacterized protein
MGKISEGKGQLALASSSAPLAPADRLAAIDALRGLALFGVMAVNLVFEFRTSIFEQFLPTSEITSPVDRSVEIFLDRAMVLKAFALFSLLFGVGLAIQFDRLAERRRTVLLLRRLITLLAIGLVHLVLIWNGDILTHYALAGLVVLPFLFGPPWLLAVAGLLFLGSYFVLSPLVPFPDSTWIAEHILAARHAYGTGTLLQVLVFRIDELPAFVLLHVSIFPRTLALFLFGAFIWRAGILRNASDNKALLFSIAIVAFVLTMGATRALANVTLAFAYGAIVIGLMTTELGSKLLGWAAPIGRMAFTNYLAQSLIFGWVFYGYGLGLFGQVRASAALAFGVAVYAAQAIFSRWWLKRYKFGPVEWLWRSLTYGAPQPMRLSKAAA